MSNDLNAKDVAVPIDPATISVVTQAADPVAMTNAVLRLLRRINRAGDLHSKELERLSGLTTPQIIVLRAIAELGEVTAGKIAAHVSLSQGTVSMILDRLEKEGLIARYRNPRDRRIVHARLTETGEKALAAAPPLLREQFMRRFLSLDPLQQVRTVEALSALADMMDTDPEPAVR